MTGIVRRNRVPDAFDREAAAYDRLVRANPGYHAHLRLSARRLVNAILDGTTRKPLRLLDLGCGTGASTAALLGAAPTAEIIAVDGSEGMLAEARRKTWPDTVSFVHARAEHLADAGVHGPFDGILAAYLVRNVPYPDLLLRDLRALLRPDGPLVAHEYSVADSRTARAVWTAVCHAVIVPAGLLLTGDASLYRYLWRSVLAFDGVDAFEARLRRAGFPHVRTAPVTGWQRGIVHTFLARAPSAPHRVHEVSSAGPRPCRSYRPGRDRRAVLHPGHVEGHARSRPDRAPTVAVVGGGIAGLSAAVALAERGVGVRLFERDGHLGGRAGGWPTVLADGTATTMTRGFHAFFRQYYNLRGLLRRVDPNLDRLVSVGDYPLLHADGRRETFAGLPRTPPLNAAAFVARSPAFGPRDLTGLDVSAGLSLLDVSVPEVYRRLDHVDADTFLDRVGFPVAARRLAFSVFSRSFFADPRDLSAAELAVMFHLYFLGSSEGLLFDVPAEPFPQAFWDPLRRYLEGLGARVATGASVRGVVPGGDRGYVVETDERPWHADAVVLATDAAGLRDLVAASPRLGDGEWRTRVSRLRNAPPFLVSRYWFDGPVHPDRPAFLGTAGFGPIDNVSVLERYDLDAQRWAARTAGSVVEPHAYAVDERTTPPDLLAAVRRVYPETADLRIVDERHELRADCPLFPPGGFADRPGTHTNDPYLVVAGDLTRVDLPVALMERAATSGFLAGNALLRQWGLRGYPVWTVPTAARLALNKRPHGTRRRLTGT